MRSRANVPVLLVVPAVVAALAMLGAPSCSRTGLNALGSSGPSGVGGGTGGGPLEGGGGDGGVPSPQPLVCGDGEGGAGGEDPMPCLSGPDDDVDGDGFTPNQGDCAPCDPRVNPAAIEVRTLDGAEPVDDDCDGVIDEPIPTCDGALTQNSFDAEDGARAIGLCSFPSPNDPTWGVLEADYVRTSLEPLAATYGVGLVDDFGVITPRSGGRMLALSTGRARDAADPEACGMSACVHDASDIVPKESQGTPPGGAYCAGAGEPCFPQNVIGCPGSDEINDDVALRLSLRAPSNADGFRFQFNFMSFEYPEWVCTEFNDQFVALVLPPRDGALLSNVSFDEGANPISVNVVFFDEIAPADLAGTGFDEWNDAAATGWLETRVPVTGGETVELLLAIWDSGDNAFDSTTLIDDFGWLVDCAEVVVETGSGGD